MRWFAILLCLACSFAAAREPRATVEAVAQAIEANYFDPVRAAQIADDLRQAAQRGEFDDFGAPLDLATALGSRLAPIDRHFKVRWTPLQADTGVVRAPRGRLPRGHGIRAVRVLPGNIGYLDLAWFAHFDFDERDALPRVAIDAALALLQATDAVIIDVRDNGGGSPAMVGYLASAFTPKGADIYNTFVSREGRSSEAPLDWHPKPRLEVPLYVLTSGRTGSAAEALSYTLKNAGRATVVGERTTGAANPGGPVDAGAGFSVFVSTGSPVSPVTGGNWEGEGVLPSIDVPSDQAMHVAQVKALETLLATSTREDPMNDVRWVLEALQAPSSYDGALESLAGDYGDLRIALGQEALALLQGRRPPRRLNPLSANEFYVDGDPTRRVAFERDAGGRVIALELRFADGNRSRFRRQD